MARTAAAFLVLGQATIASATTATDTFTATLPTATETFTLPTAGQTETHTFTLPTSTATFTNYTMAPTGSPTNTPSMAPSMAPSATPSHSPTGAPSQSPSQATQAPTQASQTPTTPDVVPADAPEETEQPSTTSPSLASQSPTNTGDTISPSTSMPTSSTDPAQVYAQIQSILNQTITFTFGGVETSIMMTAASYAEVAGAVVYTTTLAETLTASQVNDRAVDGFVHALSIALAGQAGISPASRIPYQTMEFTGVAAAGRRSRTLGSGVKFSVCDMVQNGVCVTYSPTGSPIVSTVPPTKKWAADDDFPGWAIALCVVLPILAIGAGVTVWYCACKSDPEAEGDMTPQSSDKPNEPAADEQKDSQV